MAEAAAAREAAAVAAGLLAYCTVLERQSLSGERATSESKKLGELANHGSSGDGSSSGCGSGSTGWIVAAGWAATVAAG